MEDLEWVLKREVLEETGIDISSARISFIDNEGSGESAKVLDTGERVHVKISSTFLE